MSNRITHTVTPWHGRFRCTMHVDGYAVSKAFFDSVGEAEQWATAKRDELAQEVRAR